MAHSTHKQGFAHYFLLLLLVGSISYGFYSFVIPQATQKAVSSLFGPHGQEGTLSTIDGVLAVNNADPYSSIERKLEAGEKLKDAIKPDFIFDFTTKKRTEDEDGYTKEGGEFLLKAEMLGEKPIILEPVQGFAILSLVFGFAISMLITVPLPASIGFMSSKFMREIEHTKTKVRLQTGFSDEIVDVLTMPDNILDASDREKIAPIFRRVWDRTAPQDDAYRAAIRFTDSFQDDVSLSDFRNQILYTRIRETFSDGVMSEIQDTRDGIRWSRNKLRIADGLRLYMTHHFAHVYSNNVTGFAYLGAAALIVIIGVRGLKFIPPTRPSLILGAIALEGSLLALLGFVLLYTSGEEPIDKVLKKVEDASRGQLDTLKKQQEDMHKMAQTLVDGSQEIVEARVKEAIVHYMTNDQKVKADIAEEVGKFIMNGLTRGVNAESAKK